MAKVQARPSLAELVREHTTSQGPKCPVGLILRDHPDQTAEVAHVLGDPTAQHKAVAKALTAYFGRRTSADAVSKHRGESCACFSAPFRGPAA